MGDPKFPRRTYETPSHPWEGERIKEEQEMVRQFGLRNKRELWKAQSILRNLRRQSRDLQARLRYGDVQAQIEKENLLKRCARLGLLPMHGGTLDDILALTQEAMLNRRLQTMVYRKGLANTQKQARQLIVHGHITVNGRKVTIPGYLVKKEEEDKIEYNPRSPFNDDMHPMRIQRKEEKDKEVSKEEAKERERSQMLKKIAQKEIIIEEGEEDLDLPDDEEAEI